MFARVQSNWFILDLLRQKDSDIVLMGMQIVLRLVQFTDIQEFVRLSDPMLSKCGAEEHPLHRLLHPTALHVLLTAPLRIRECVAPDVTLNKQRIAFRKLSHKLWSVIDAGITRFGLVFAQALRPFGAQLALYTDLDSVTISISLGMVDIISQLAPAPRMDALMGQNAHVVNALVSIIIDHSNPDVAEASVLHAMQLLRAFATQQDLPVDFRRHMMQVLKRRQLSSALAEFVVLRDTDIGIESLDLCLALTTVAHELSDLDGHPATNAADIVLPVSGYESAITTVDSVDDARGIGTGDILILPRRKYHS